MKTTTYFITSLFATTLIMTYLFGTSSCNYNKKNKDTKEVAEEHNEAKFDNTTKEKDAQFLVNAAEINLEEIKLGQLAQENSSMSDVQDLGAMMAKEHSKCMDDLIILAKKKVVSIPTLPTDNALEAYNKLKPKSGADFNTAYCDMMVNGHKNAIAAFEKAAKETSDESIRKWATATLPNLRMHLNHAIACQKKCEKM